MAKRLITVQCNICGVKADTAANSPMAMHEKCWPCFKRERDARNG